MVSIEICNKILNSSDRKYTDEEVSEIRRKLYNLAKLEYELYQEKVQRNEKCIDLHPCEYGRTG